MKKKEENTRSDWSKIDTLKNNQIDYSDSPELNDDFWENAQLIVPKPKVKITLRLDSEIFEWFKSKGKGYQTKINSVLKSYVKACH